MKTKPLHHHQTSCPHLLILRTLLVPLLLLLQAHLVARTSQRQRGWQSSRSWVSKTRRKRRIDQRIRRSLPLLPLLLRSLTVTVRSKGVENLLEVILQRKALISAHLAEALDPPRARPCHLLSSNNNTLRLPRRRRRRHRLPHPLFRPLPPHTCSSRPDPRTST